MSDGPTATTSSVRALIRVPPAPVVKAVSTAAAAEPRRRRTAERRSSGLGLVRIRTYLERAVGNATSVCSCTYRKRDTHAQSQLRATGLGSTSFENDKAVTLSPRQQLDFDCPAQHHFSVVFSVEAQLPTSWACPTCWASAARSDGVQAEAKDLKPARAHWDRLLERRSVADSKRSLLSGSHCSRPGSSVRTPTSESLRPGRERPLRPPALRRGDAPTALTRAFTGRTARGIINRFLRDHADSPSAYPEIHHLTTPLRTAARTRGDTDGFHRRRDPRPADRAASRLLLGEDAHRSGVTR